MYNKIMDVLPFFLLVIFVFKMKIVKPFSVINEEYLSIETCRAYKGLLALVVVFHHLAQRTENGLLFHQFAGVGYLTVSVFFFFSGYGLQKSYMNSDNYKKGFLLRRLPTILIPYILVTFIYWLMNCALGNIYSIKDMVGALVRGVPIDRNSWYIIAILVFYIVFWLLMVLCKKRYFLMLLGAFLWYVFYVGYCMGMGYGEYWFNTSHLLIVGMFWAICERRILAIIEKNYLLFSITMALLLALLLCVSSSIALLIPLKGIGVIMTALKAFLFTVSVMLFSLRFKVGNKALAFLGKISFEIYMLHGLFVTILRSDIIYIHNEVLWCAFVFLCTIVFASFMHIVFDKILSVCKVFM